MSPSEEDVQAYFSLYRTLLQTGQWEQIPSLPLFPEEASFSVYWFIRDLVRWIPSATDAVNELIRHFPERGPREWTTFLSYCTEFLQKDLVRAFLARNMLDLSHNRLLLAIVSTDMNKLTTEQQKEMVEMAMEVGLDVNEYNESGYQPFLHVYLYLFHEYLRGVLYQTDRVVETMHDMLPWLLEKGADPLLEDRKGRNAIALVSDMRMFPPSIKTWILRELEKWA